MAMGRANSTRLQARLPRKNAFLSLAKKKKSRPTTL